MWPLNRRGIRTEVRAADSLDLKGPFVAQFRDGIITVHLSGGDGTMAGTTSVVNLSETPRVILPNATSDIVFRGGRPGGGWMANDDHDDHDHDGDGHNDHDRRHGDMQGGPPGQTPATAPTYNYPGTLMGQVALVRQTLYDAKAYAATKDPKADPAYEGLRPLVTGQIPMLGTIGAAREVFRLARLAEEFQVTLIVNGPPDAYRALNLLKSTRAGVIVNLDIPEEPTRTVGTGLDAAPKAVLEERYRIWETRLTNPTQLSRAGVPIAFRGRLGSQGYLAGVRRYVKAGLPRDAALRAMTLGAAEMLGVSNSLGTIEVNKTANVVLMNGDFTDDKAQVLKVVVDGRVVDIPKSERPGGTR